MSLGVLVRRNVLDPVRSRSLWLYLGVFALVFGLVGYMISASTGGGYSIFVPEIMAVLAPLAALAFTYDAIAGPRESGSLRVLLSYPYTRRELLLGTLVGRTVVVAVGIVVGVLVGALVLLVFGGSVDFGELFAGLGLTLLLSTAIVGLTLGISASVRTPSRAAVVAFGAYLLFSAFWGLIPTLVRWVLGGFSFPSGPRPEWVAIWNQLNPVQAFRTATGSFLQGPTGDAFYFGLWFSVLVLAGWFVLSTLIGLVRFERSDL